MLQDIALSSGSACTSASLEPSYVLRALGIIDRTLRVNFRLSNDEFQGLRKTWHIPLFGSGSVGLPLKPRLTML